MPPGAPPTGRGQYQQVLQEYASVSASTQSCMLSRRRCNCCWLTWSSIWSRSVCALAWPSALKQSGCCMTRFAPVRMSARASAGSVSSSHSALEKDWAED